MFRQGAGGWYWDRYQVETTVGCLWRASGRASSWRASSVHKLRRDKRNNSKSCGISGIQSKRAGQRRERSARVRGPDSRPTCKIRAPRPIRVSARSRGVIPLVQKKKATDAARMPNQLQRGQSGLRRPFVATIPLQEILMSRDIKIPARENGVSIVIFTATRIGYSCFNLDHNGDFHTPAFPVIC